MSRTSSRRVTRGIATLFALAMCGALAPAQLATADPCPPLAIGCVVAQTTGTTGGVITQTTGTVGGTVEQTGTTVGGTVEQTGTTVGGTVGGTVGTTVTQTTGTVGGVITQTSGTVGGTVTQAGGTAGGTISQTGATVGGTVTQAGGAVGGTVTQAGGDVPGTLGGSTTGGTEPGQVVPGGGTVQGGGPSTGGGPSAGGPVTGFGSGATVSAQTPTATTTGSIGAVITGAAAGPRPRDTWDGLQAFLRGTLAIAKTIAFPIALILLVAGFLLVQSRIDRKDPKLALAPVASEYLTFS